MTNSQLRYQELQEAKRSNMEREAENKRHNMEQERLGLIGAEETQRHDKSSEGVQTWQNVINGAKIVAGFIPKASDVMGALGTALKIIG